MAKIGINETPLILKEYGRNIQKLANYLKTIEDKEKRNQSAYALVDLMKQINPSSKESPDNLQKIWDDLFIISDFDLDVDSPYPIPDKSLLFKKPLKMDYNVHNIKYKHYGHNISLMVKKAVEMESEEEREAATLYIGKLMKSFYITWNKENIDDSVIVDNIKEISGGKLDVDVNKVKENNLFDSTHKEKSRSSGKGKRSYSGGGRKRKN